MATSTDFAVRLIDHYRAHARDLPWRRDREPWSVWVSEIMLQQTRVEVVQHIHPRFLAEYPRPADFAAVDDDQLLAAWKGLGYYRRARLLREGARAVVAEHAGAVPADAEALAALPGIGPYTLAALGSIAFDLPLAAVDGNVERVAARHRGIDQDVKRGAGKRAVRETAETWLDRSQPGDFNQALMELGATICTPRNPDCPACPVAADCVARAEGRQTDWPVLPARKAAVPVQAAALLVPQPRGTLLGYRIPEGEINAGQIDLPGAGLLQDTEDAEALASALERRFGAGFCVADKAAAIRHGITHHRITLQTWWGQFEGPCRAPLLRAAPDDPQVPWTTAARKVFASLGLPG